ncbi:MULTISPECIES: hypothetical protein [Halostella]|uniref:DUF7550 family protein n=1 Tax=Halostella TaxID=1843185 RepID=UPI00143D1C1E|nr:MULTISPECIES: hypothetical protein [Halostella]
MTGEDEHGHQDTDAPDVEPGRETAPQSPYSMQQVGIGFAVLAVGLAVAFAIPLAL